MFGVVVCYLCSVLMCHKCHVTRVLCSTLRSGNKQWHFLVLSTLTSVNTITMDSKCLCDKVLQKMLAAGL